jgi:hypothetical protein
MKLVLMLLECLIIRQPYASLIAFGHKRWEFRKSDSKKRGLIGIAASPNEPLPTKNQALNNIMHKLPRGVVLATAKMATSFFVTAADLKSHITNQTIVDLHGYQIQTVLEPIGEPLSEIDFAIKSSGWQRYAWLIEDVVPLQQPVLLGKLERSTWLTMEVPTDGKTQS